MAKRPDIKTLEDARRLIFYVSRDLMEEIVPDACPGTWLTPAEAADAMVEEGVITQETADKYLDAVKKHPMKSAMFDWMLDEVMDVLTGGTVKEDDHYTDYGDSVMAVFYAVVYLHDPKFRNLFWENLEEAEMEVDDEWQDVELLDISLPFPNA